MKKMKTSEKTEEKVLKNPKAIVCLYKINGHKTFRIVNCKSIEDVEKHLKVGCNNQKITAKKFFEVDLLAGTLEEF